ncbi:hypothetical protein [Paenibacillus sp. FSL H8-0034]|uniref:hypothetical protein n=1 Tax=Paenibacillus sp. FSL H8-0034 TaxID=2954671 RepID=UPI0030F754E2
MLIAIKKNYSNFDTSDENIDRHLKYLHDFPFAAAMKNVDMHIMTEDYPPKISNIRGHLGDLQDSQRSKDEAAAFQAKLDRWAADDRPPPNGYWERVRQKLQRKDDQ